MTRGTFANIRLRNQLAPGTEGGFTTYYGPEETKTDPIPGLPYDSAKDPKPGEVTSIYDAAIGQVSEGTASSSVGPRPARTTAPGSSRDWAAKGTRLLGVKAVIVESFERIHRSNLVGMGVLPLQFTAGMTRQSLALTGEETFDVTGIEAGLTPRMELALTIHRPDGGSDEVALLCRIDTADEVDYYRHGGILHYVLRNLKNAAA